MAFAIRLAQLNIDRETGGPFGAAVFERDEGGLVAAGVNLVLHSGYSFAHAEVVALSLAQRAAGTFDLAAAGPPYELVSSAEPCAMCAGASCWSGIAHLVCGARREDVEAIGFDEGPRSPDWVAQLTARGVPVTRDISREQAAAVLQSYRARGGSIYNARP